MKRAVLALALAACGRADPSPPSPSAPPPPPPPPSPSLAAAPADAGVVASLEDGLAGLRAAGLAAAADVIARRVAQRRPKMRLSREEGRAAAAALLALSDRQAMRALHAVMPRSTVELARAVAERGVPVADADQIARYLVRVVDALEPERLATFDDNHSHVTGRDWQEIDYAGEGMTWQRQKAFWAPRGVTSFRKAELIHAYFTAAERMEHWQRVYRPRGRMSDLR